MFNQLRILLLWSAVAGLLAGDALAKGKEGRGGGGSGGQASSSRGGGGGDRGGRSSNHSGRSSGSSGRSSGFSGRSDLGSSRSGGSRSFSAPSSRDRSSFSRGDASSLGSRNFSSRGGSSRDFSQQTPNLRGGDRAGNRAGERSNLNSRFSQPPSSFSRGDARSIGPRNSTPNDALRSHSQSNLSQRNRGGDARAAQAIRDARSSTNASALDRRQQLSNRVRLPDGRPLNAAQKESIDQQMNRNSAARGNRSENSSARSGRPPRDLILGGDRGAAGDARNAARDTAARNAARDSSRLGSIRPQNENRVRRPDINARLGNRTGTGLDSIGVPNSDRHRPGRTVVGDSNFAGRGDGRENRDRGNVTNRERFRGPRDVRDVTDANRVHGPRDSVRIPGGRDVSRVGDRARSNTSFKPVTRRPAFDDATAARLSRQNWVDRTDRGRVDRLTQLPEFRRAGLHDQWRLHGRGDVARQVGLHRNLERAGGWNHRHVGWVSPRYRNTAFYRSYWGPRCFPRNAWYPTWRPWVSWSWGYSPLAWFDPRPVFCRPILYNPCPVWTSWQYPIWQPLPVVASGTWVDVPQVVVEDGIDLQLLAVRFVDPGFAEQNLGPRYRVWIRNNTNRNIDQPFDVVAMGANERQIGERRVETGQRVTSIDAGETIALDMRLPLTVADAGGDPFEFSLLHVLVDAGKALNDSDMTNNGAIVERDEILPVDPAVFDAENPVVESGSIVTVAAEGLGPEPGQVLLHAGGKTYEPEILGWYDLGLRVRLPEIPAAELTEADLVVIRGDGAAANPLTLQVAPHVAGRLF